MSFDLASIRAQFPVLSREVNGQPLAYLDSAASAQKPQVVIDAESRFYQHGYAAVHRGIHTLSAEATTEMENVREQAATFLNAASAEEIVFVKGTTEAINLVASSWGGSQLQPGDNILITAMEHHANIVPWQMVAQRTGAEVRFIPLTEMGELDLSALSTLIDSRTRMLAVTQVSNVLGTVNPAKELVAYAKAAGVATLIDGAQAVMHEKVDVQALGCDFYAFSGHKIYGPSGIGILYGRKAVLDQMPPWEGGGSMIATVSLTENTTYAAAPWRFEAGSPNTGGIIGLGAALHWVSELGLEAIRQREQVLMRYAMERLAEVPDLHIYGPQARAGVIAFNLGQHHAYDVGSFLDRYGLAIRTGHHCAMPLMNHYGVPAMCRASFVLYNSEEEADRLAARLTRIHRLLG
ncbi:cysteine desulfurase SufS [Erwinia mallotivora]|uniref:cysteine desulfurase SufS n=1 Tax=Erwinia mallotivora TaxID=69222 RepID=UPI0035F0B34B